MIKSKIYADDVIILYFRGKRACYDQFKNICKIMDLDPYKLLRDYINDFNLKNEGCLDGNKKK